MLTINDKAIQEALCPALQTILYPGATPAVLIVSAEQSAPRPQTSTFVDIRVAGTRQVGHGEVGAIDNLTGFTHVDAHYEIDIRIRIIGANAREVATEVEFALANRPDVWEAIDAAVGIAYSRETEMTHVPVLVDNRFEQRSQFVATFFAPVQKLIDLGYIASIEDIVMTYNGIVNPLTIHSGPIDITT